MTNGKKDFSTQITNSNNLLMMCDHVFYQMKVGFPVYTAQLLPVFKEDSGRVVLCDICVEKSRGGNWQQVPVSRICEHCFAQTAFEIRQQRKVN